MLIGEIGINLEVTSLYAAVLSLLYVALSLYVVRTRTRLKVRLLDGGLDTLTRAIRAHANFIEYTPLFILLLAFTELQGLLTGQPLHALGMAYLAARFLHAYALLVAEPKNQTMLPRKLGMITTLSVMVILSGILLRAVLA